MRMIPPLAPPTGDLRAWAREAHMRLVSLIERDNRPHPRVVQLQHKDPGAKALDDGLMMWDNTNKCPVVSKDGVWRKVTLT